MFLIYPYHVPIDSDKYHNKDSIYLLCPAFNVQCAYAAKERL